MNSTHGLNVINSMFGLIDVLSIKLNRNSQGTCCGLKRYFVEQEGSMTWVCFLPWRTDLETARKHHLLPKSGNLLVYKVPDNLLGSTPELTLEAFDCIRQDFESALEKYDLASKEIAFWGLSAGTIPAFYFANRYTCKKLVAVCPTARLGEGIFTARAARKIKKVAVANGYTAETYDNSISEINIENNLDKLPEDVTIYLARFDRFVPYSGGEEVAVKIGKNVSLKVFNFFGHIMALYFFGRVNLNGK